jgi:5'-nucleotidase (lipoprotein e(P4) family)
VAHARAGRGSPRLHPLEAHDNLQRAGADRTWTAATEQTGDYGDLPAAVILDLDETVLDNSAFEGQLVRDRTVYSPAAWQAWVESASATPLPGAQEFLSAAAAAGITLFFVTNRTVEEQPATLRNLASIGIAASDESVLCVGENGWTSDKSGRRAEVAKTHRILLLVGDDLNDFVQTAKLNVAQRLDLARRHANWWGERWILIPNPLYGSWERAITAGATEDAEVLKRKRDAVTASDR